MKPLEKEVIKILLKGLNAAPGCKAIKIHNSGYMESGTPDIIASIKGRMLLIEAKRDPSKNPTDIQEKRLNEWGMTGAMVSVIKGVEQARAFVNSLQQVDLPTYPDLTDGQ